MLMTIKVTSLKQLISKALLKPHSNVFLWSEFMEFRPKYEAMGMKYGSGEREAAVDGHDHGEVLFQTSPSRKHLWDIESADDTLESIVHSSLSRKRPRSNSECKDQTNLMSLASSEKSHKSGFKTKNFVEDLAQDHDHGLVMLKANSLMFFMCFFLCI